MLPEVLEYAADLEAKLTQKDKQLEKLKSDNHALISDNAYQEADIFELNSRIEQLQKQLTEKETEIGFLEGTINSMQEDISYWEQKLTEKEEENEILTAKLEQADEIINNPDTLIFQQQELIDNLQAQLTEKNKEIEELKYIKIIPTPINTLDLEKFKEYLNDTYFISTDTCKSQITLLNQNEKAIEQLEKVKEILIQNADEIGEEYKEDYFMISLGNVKNIIDNQIKQLKEKK